MIANEIFGGTRSNHAMPDGSVFRRSLRTGQAQTGRSTTDEHSTNYFSPAVKQGKIVTIRLGALTHLVSLDLWLNSSYLAKACKGPIGAIFVISRSAAS